MVTNGEPAIARNVRVAMVTDSPRLVSASRLTGHGTCLPSRPGPVPTAWLSDPRWRPTPWGPPDRDRSGTVHRHRRRQLR